MSNPLVSVIIPNYNHAIYLEERIQSVLSQTYKNFEVIIMDDFSTDNSKEVIEKYRTNPHVSKIIYNDANGGSPFKQWKRGFNEAKGDYVWIAESDDAADSSLLQVLMDLFHNNEECVLAFCKSLFVNQCGEEVDGRSIQEGYSDFVMQGKLFVRKFLGNDNFVINASSAVFKKSVLDKIVVDYERFHGCGDWVLWAEISLNGYIAYSSKPLNYYRQHSNNTTQLLARSGRGIYEAYKTLSYFYINGYTGKEQYIKKKWEIMVLISHNKNLSYKNKKDLYKQCHCNVLDYIMSELYRIYRFFYRLTKK